jgi:hypothetical protein
MCGSVIIFLGLIQVCDGFLFVFFSSKYPVPQGRYKLLMPATKVNFALT